MYLWNIFLLARLMGQYCFARCRLSASVTCVGGRAGRLAGPAANTAQRDSTVMSHQGDTSFVGQMSPGHPTGSIQ